MSTALEENEVKYIFHGLYGKAPSERGTFFSQTSVILRKTYLAGKSRKTRRVMRRYFVDWIQRHGGIHCSVGLDRVAYKPS